MTNLSFSDLSPEQQSLLQQAEKVMANAYDPYSKFMVGAAVRTGNGKTYVGANVGNASYGLCICAEPSALVAASAAGDRRVECVAVIGKSQDFETVEPVTPCGRCRQFIYEFASLSGIDTEVICSNSTKDKILVAKISELLPQAFGPGDLKIDVTRYL